MKRIHSTLAFLVAAGLCVSAQTFKSVTVNLANGGKTEVTLSDDLSATFDDDNLVITGGDQDISVPRTSIKSFTFSETTGIDKVDADAATPVVNGDSMVFTDLPEGSVVAVYTASGVLVSQAAVKGAYTLDLSTLPSGIALVNVNGVTYKIAVKK